MAYKIGELLGQGGMGAVFLVTKEQSAKKVAYKQLLRTENQSQDSVEAGLRLRDEARATNKVNHPGLVRLLDSGEDESNGPFIVYEYIAGGTLAQYLSSRGPMALDEFLDKLATPLLEAMTLLHEAGVVHRDIKPDNIFRRQDGSFALGDLGLAFFEGREAKTKTGLIVGTPGYGTRTVHGQL